MRLLTALVDLEQIPPSTPRRTLLVEQARSAGALARELRERGTQGRLL